MASDIGNGLVGIGVFLIPIVGSIALFSFLAVASWADARRRERETYYTTETLKKLAEGSGDGAKSALEYLHEQRRSVDRRRLEGMKLGGLITSAVGIGLGVFLHGIAREEPVYLIGLMVFLIGLALSIYAFALAPKM